MGEERLNRIEDMLTTIIKMNGTQNEKLSSLSQDQAVMKEEVHGLKEGLSGLKEEMSSMKDVNSKRHAEILNKLADVQADQDYIWKKAASNERDLEKLKTRLRL